MEELRAIFGHLPCEMVRTSIRTAEMLKYACNAFHAVKVTFANEIGRICPVRRRRSARSHEAGLHGSPTQYLPRVFATRVCVRRLLLAERSQGTAVPREDERRRAADARECHAEQSKSRRSRDRTGARERQTPASASSGLSFKAGYRRSARKSARRDGRVLHRQGSRSVHLRSCREHRATRRRESSLHRGKHSAYRLVDDDRRRSARESLGDSRRCDEDTGSTVARLPRSAADSNACSISRNFPIVAPAMRSIAGVCW